MILNQWVKFCTVFRCNAISVRFASLAFMVLLSFYLTKAEARTQNRVIVTIDVNQPEHHMADITIEHPATTNNELFFQFPAWRTGKYQILDLAKGVREFRAQNAQGEALAWEKVDKSTWKVQSDQQPVAITYQLYANELGSRTRHIDDSHAFLDATAAIFYTQTSRPLEHVINLKVPSGWRSVSGMPYGETKHQFIAPDYDVLADSPIETGLNRLYKFRVGKQDYEVVIWGKGNYDTEKIVEDYKTLVKQSKKIWDGFPYDRYVFMIHATSGVKGATEHLNSTIIQRSRYTFSEPSDYLSFLSTSAHELVHTWNVKAYRPAGLVPYDYQNENYSQLLWLAEGSTSYLQDKLLTYGGLMNAPEYIAKVAKKIVGYQHKPGRGVQSVAQSSFDEWIDEGGDRGNNASVDIYSEGFLISWLLDFELLSGSGGDISYADVHRELYNRHRVPYGFTEQDVLTILKDLTGKDFTQWWQQHVHGTPEVNFAKVLKKVGLEMVYGNGKDKPWMGAKTEIKGGQAFLTRVEMGSPAWDAGLTIDDIVVAIEGLRFTDDTLDERLKNFAPEQEIKVTFFRRDELMTKTVILGKKPAQKLSVQVVDKPSRRQKRLFKAWTGLALPTPPKA